MVTCVMVTRTLEAVEVWEYTDDWTTFRHGKCENPVLGKFCELKEKIENTNNLEQTPTAASREMSRVKG